MFFSSVLDKLKEVASHPFATITDSLTNKTISLVNETFGTDGTYKDSITDDSEDTVTNKPTISGGENGSALNTCIPLILGKTYISPKYIGNPYTTLKGKDGETERFHVLYRIGYKDLKVENIKLGINPISTNDGNTYGIPQTSGTTASKQQINEGYPYLDSNSSGNQKGVTLFDRATYEPRIEIRQSSECSLYPQKVVQTEYNTKLLYPLNDDGTASEEKRLHVYGFSAKYPHKVQLQIQLDGLYAKSNSEDAPATASVGCVFSYDGGDTWHDFGIKFNADSTGLTSIVKETQNVYINANNTSVSVSCTKFTGCLKTVLRYYAEREFTWAEINETNGTFTYTENGETKHGIKNNVLRFIMFRFDNDAVDSTTQNSITFTKMLTYCYDYKKSKTSSSIIAQVPMIQKYRERCTRIAFEINAGQNTEGRLGLFNCEVTTKAPVWNSANQEWESTYDYTDNPSSMALLVLQGAHRGLEKYRYPDSKLDLASFGKFYERCAELLSDGYPRYRCHGAVLKATATNKLVADILAVGHANLVLIDGKYTVVIDEPRTDDKTVSGNLQPVMVLNAQNVFSAKNGKTFAEKIDGYEVTFTNEFVDYQEDKMLIKFTDTDDDLAVYEPISLPYITDPLRVKRFCAYLYACRVYRPEIFYRTIGLEGYLANIGDLIELQDVTILTGIGEGGEVLELILDENEENIIGIKTDGDLTVADTSKYYGLEFNKVIYENGIAKNRTLKLKLKPFTKTGYYSEFYFDEAISLSNTVLVEVGDIFSFGFFNSITMPVILTDKKDNGNSDFDCTFIPYQNAVYTFEDEQELVDYVSNVTPLQEVAPPLNNNVDVTTFNEKITTIKGEKGDKGDTGTARVLQSLTESGTEDELGIYNGEVYVYKNNRWNSQKGDTTPPTIPQVTSGSTDASGNITISFQHSTDEESGVKEYNIYRKIVNGTFVLIATISDDGTQNTITFKDIIAKKNQVYIYCVTAVDNEGNESGYSTELSVESVVTVAPVLPINISSVANENEIIITWKNGNTSIAEAVAQKYIISLSRDNGETWNQIDVIEGITEAHYKFNRTIDLYPEITTLQNYKIRIKSVSEWGVESDWSDLVSIDTSTYKTWVITAPNLTAIAEESGILINWNLTNDSYGDKVFDLYEGNTVLLSNTRSTTYYYPLENHEDTDVVEDKEFKIVAKSVAGTGNSLIINPDVTNYLGYTPSLPEVFSSATSRNVNLKWAEQNIYGWNGVDIQVAKGYKIVNNEYVLIEDESELEWYAPALGLNPYSSYDNYKKGEIGGYLNVKGTSVSFSLPLYGQADESSVKTMYVYRLRAKSITKQTQWTNCIYVEVSPVSAYDVVKSWKLNASGEKVKVDGALGANQIFVEELSAICANIGYITDGALQSDQYNYWAINDTPLKDGSILHKGAFRVGGSTQYIEVIPVLENGEPTGEYDVNFVVDDVIINSQGTRINGKSFEVYDTEDNLIFKASPEGNSILVEEGEYLTSEPLYYELPIINGLNDYEDAQHYNALGLVLYVYYYEGNVFSVLISTGDNNSFINIFKNKEIVKRIDVSDVVYDNAFSFYPKLINDKIVFSAGNDVYKFYPVNDTLEKINKINITMLGKGTNYYLFIKRAEKIYNFTKVYDVENDTVSDTIGFDNSLTLINNSNDYFIYVDNEEIYFLANTTYFTVLVQYNTSLNKHFYRPLPFKIDAIKITEGEEYYNYSLQLFSNHKLLCYVNSPKFFSDSGTTVAGNSCICELDLNNLTWYESLGGATVLDSANINIYEVEDNQYDFYNIKNFITSVPICGLRKKEYAESCYNEIRINSFEFIDYEIPEKKYLFATIKGYVNFRSIFTFDLNTKGVLMNMSLINSCYFLTEYYYNNQKYMLFSMTGVSFYMTEVEPPKYAIFCDTNYENITRKRVYSAGIGFKSILYDKALGRYKYKLDSGAYLEFDSNGRLIATGPTGPQGNKGDKGDKGDDGASLVDVEQTQTSTQSSGENVITFTLADGTTRNVSVYNGEQGDTTISITDADLDDIFS